jgi:excisionase family DNA binding protein
MNLSIMEREAVPQSNVTASNKLGYTVEEVSEQSSLSKAFLRQKIREGKLKATYFGRRVVILRDDLEAFLKKGSK